MVYAQSLQLLLQVSSNPLICIVINVNLQTACDIMYSMHFFSFLIQIIIFFFFKGLPVVARTTAHPVTAQKSKFHGRQLSNSHTNTTVSLEFHLFQVHVENDNKRILFAFGRQSVWRGYDRWGCVLRKERRQDRGRPVILTT